MGTVLVFYQYFHPDDVVSAVHLTQLSTELSARGWHVVAMPCNRGCRDEGKTYGSRDNVQGVEIRRVWRPRFRQARNAGRIANAVWMIAAWSCVALNPRVKCDAVIIGTDPVLSLLTAIVWRFVRPRVLISHWCFDLHPESGIADGLLRESSPVVRLLRRMMRRAYGCCDMIADIGECMRRKLDMYEHKAVCVTLPPWGLEEPTDSIPVADALRSSLFGTARLGLLYSGSFGRAHTFDTLLQLAELVSDAGVTLTFSVRGNREQALRRAVAAGPPNVRMGAFVPQEQLAQQLASADIHVVSLHDAWTGTVVPSKFFGALAIGRPVIFAGSSESAIGGWITAHRVGWVLNAGTLTAVAAELRRIADDPAVLQRLHTHCHRVYREHFSRSAVVTRWSDELVKLVRPATLASMALPANPAAGKFPAVDADRMV